jgi:DNA-3-methyladenine glycosylase
MKKLSKEFFNRDTVIVAKELVGKILCVDDKCVRILKTEAYKTDKASHARVKTPRSTLMYETYGHVYVYLIYGMYYCLNFTTDSSPGAVLIRSVEGANDPGKLCNMLNITKKDNGEKLGKRFKILDDGYKAKTNRSERIGIKEDKNLLWRFLDIKLN